MKIANECRYIFSGESKMKKSRDEWPVMVHIALLGITSRSLAWAFFWMTVALGSMFIICAFFDLRFLIGCGFYLAAIWYYLAIEWVDKNGEWGMK